MRLYDLYCQNCRKAYHHELWKPCPSGESVHCRYCGWCEKDQDEEACNKRAPSDVQHLGPNNQVVDGSK
jgi:hypothetical protein